MNPLEALKQKLKIKPKVEEQKLVQIRILHLEEEKTNMEEKEEPKEERKRPIVTIVDKRKEGYDRETLLKKLAESKLLKVTVKPVLQASQKPPLEPVMMVSKETVIPATTKAKKIGKKKLLIVDEEEEEKEEQKEELEKPTRKTKKIEKGIAVLGPESVVVIGDTPISKRLPPKQSNVIIRVPNYYMNNREIFVNFINSLFEPYRRELQENKESISCDSIGRDSSDFSLLTHQKIVRDYMNLYTPYRGLLLYHGLGSGKCHLKDTPIIMIDGSIKMVQDIQVGDLLMGDDSTPRTVTSLAKGRDKMYDIIPVKGEKYTVNEEHILCLKASGFPKICLNNHKCNTNYNVQWIQNNKFQSKTFTFQKNDEKSQQEMKIKADAFFQEIQNNKETSENIIEISVKDYLELSDKKKNMLKGYRVPIDLPEKELPFDPYMVGYWLGDGTSRDSTITSQDSTVLYYFAKNLPQYGLNLNLRYGSYYYGISGDGKRGNNVFLKTLKELNLQNNKHIPYVYKCNSRVNRLKLLAGLLDSDGHYSSGTFEFTQKNETLINDIIYLARSLGFACYKKEKKTSWTYNGIKKQGTAWRITISGEGLEQIPTLIPRKQAHPRQQIKDVLVTGITVEYVGINDYYGFTLDANCRYVIGDFTVTHNTCTSIAIAEGMKEAKRVIIMTPASLRTNYMEELKKCGDLLYKKNQFWEWFSIDKKPEILNTLSAVLNLPVEYIRRKKGAWFVNITKKANYSELSSNDKKSLDDQLDEMIRNKYIFINYNGLRNKRLEELTDGFTKNLFDNSIVIIDEAHNLVSRIVNKIKKEKPIAESDKGEKEHAPKFLSIKLYEYLLSAQDARVILLSGTPVINYPNEFAILFNILRGYIKTWEIPLDVKTSKKIDQNSLAEMLLVEKTMDYLDYSPSSKILTITRNPFGFKNKITKRDGYQGVGQTDTVFNSDDAFERRIISVLKQNDIEILSRGIKVRNKKALPDTLELFEGNYINDTTKEIKNVDALKRRILGLSSYFRSAQESLLPKYEKLIGVDYHIVRIPMSDFQFKIYEEARKEERKLESKPKRKTGSSNSDDLYKEPSSTYRIFSRLFCNFVMPNRPMPLLEFSDKKDKEEEEEEKREKRDEEGKEEGIKKGKSSRIETLLKTAKKAEDKQDMNVENEGEVEGDQILDEIGGGAYKERLENAIHYIQEHSNDFLTPEALQTYSPKFLHILENIQDPDHAGLHLVYSQFRTLEGVGVFSEVLKKNGFARFTLKKESSIGLWKIDIPEKDQGKPTFALYTGTESAEEKEMIRNIYNGDWNYLPTNIAEDLKKRANNNNMGEIIKVLMITSSGSEGINLRNTRYVHIMEPYWHPVRLEQVIGRARRICSHKDLPPELQTVEVFVYLMIFSAEQLKSDASIELKRKDLSKGVPHVPVTSDQYLYEISEIKANLTKQLTDIIKQSAFDCYIYSNGQCINFAEPTNTKFAYVPDYAEQQSDITLKTNVKKIEWVGKPISINGVDYVYRRVSPKILNIYDKNSYLEAMKNPGVDPVLIGTYEINEKGQQVFKQLVT